MTAKTWEEVYGEEAEAKRRAEAAGVVAAPQIDPTDVLAVRAATWAWLVKTLSLMPPTAQGLPIARELLDRMDGKPAQMINTTLNATVTNTIQIVRFSDGKVIDQINNDKIQDVVIEQSQLRTTNMGEEQQADNE